MPVGNYDHDEDLIHAVQRDGRGRARVYRLPRTAVVLGRGSKVQYEVHERVCMADGVPVVRRRGGGCAVVIDPGNVIVSVVVGAPGFGHSTRDIVGLTEWLIGGLRDLGVDDLTHQGISDIAQAGRKVAGSCIYRARGLLYYSASLLVAADLALIDRYLAHPSREPAYRDGRGHLDFVGLLDLPEAITTPRLLEQALGDRLTLPEI